MTALAAVLVFWGLLWASFAIPEAVKRHRLHRHLRRLHGPQTGRDLTRYTTALHRATVAPLAKGSGDDVLAARPVRARPRG